MIARLSALLWGSVVISAAFGDRQVAVTVYNQDFAVIKDARTFDLPKGQGRLTFTDVAARIDPTSVQVTSPTDPTFTVLEQNFENNLVDSGKLLEKMIDQPVTVLLEDGKSFTGRLLAAEEGALTLQTDEGIKIIERNQTFGQIVLPRPPEGLLLRPTLVWQIRTATGGSGTVQIAYQTDGFNWNADYNVLVRPDKHTLDLNGWVTIRNASGSRFPDARLKLVAGEVHKVRPEERIPRPLMMRKAMVAMDEAAMAPPGFQERAFAEYHLYDLGRKTTIEDNETKQIEFLNARDVRYTTEYLFQEHEPGFHWNEFEAPPTGDESLRPLKVVATVENKEANQLGQPLPAGNVRMYQEDAQGTDRLVGQDRIEHTPKDEKVRLTMGNAFDVVGSRQLVSVQRPNRNTLTHQIVVRIRNHKDKPVPVVVRDTLMSQMNWTIEQTSETYRKIDYRTIEFRFNLDANAEKVIRYRVRYEQVRW